MKRRIAKKVAGKKMPRRKTTGRVQRAPGRTRAVRAKAAHSDQIQGRERAYTYQAFHDAHFAKVAIPITLASALVLG